MVTVWFEGLHEFVYGVIVRIEPVITGHPLAGALAFTILAAASAMLAFFSSVVLVPVAVQAWGQTVTLLLLWAGWLLGGMGGYGIGRWLGRPLVRTLAGGERLARYQQLVTRHAPFPMVLLLQLALPTEVPGYLLGTLRYRFGLYVLALALAELPYVLGTVYLGDLYLKRQDVRLLLIGGLGIALVAGSFHLLQRVLRNRDLGDE
jgi:uncharacterized membrane protein YdjX (TVP38/TMEM64 family)